MTVAAELARSGAASGTMVVADEQTSGQGRFGRTWHSEPGAGLYVTFILRPELGPENLPVVTLALGLAAAEAISETTGIACDLRWPNDVLVNDRKCAGILTQLFEGALLAGIGMNVNHTSFPEEIAGIATSLRLATDREHSRETLLDALARAVASQMDLLVRSARSELLRAFEQASSYVHGRRVIVDTPDAELRGITDGLNDQGFLWLQQDDGRRILIIAGGVRPECS
jgi:BirA family biotin operon repressor/biotin-[acetyl-CoA-carboxylase] ligase